MATRPDHLSVGVIPVGKTYTLLPAEFGLVRAAEISIENEQMVVRQFSLVCIFCGAVTAHTLRGFGICATCCKEAKKLKRG